MSSGAQSDKVGVVSSVRVAPSSDTLAAGVVGGSLESPDLGASSDGGDISWVMGRRGVVGVKALGTTRQCFIYIPSCLGQNNGADPWICSSQGVGGGRIHFHMGLPLQHSTATQVMQGLLAALHSHCDCMVVEHLLE